MSLNDESSMEGAHSRELIARAVQGDESAVTQLFNHYHDRLKRMVRLRLDRRLQGRVDEDDILQDAYFDVSRRLAEYNADSQLPFFLWLRHMVGLKLAETQRHHLGTQKRDANLEISLYRGPLPEANSASLAAQLMGSLTSPSDAAAKAEMRIIVQETLNGMEPVDREILALKHFEQLSIAEIGQLLGLSKAGAGSRYLRAIKRLKTTLSQIPGFEGI